ncbi:hypothetical protein MSG28_013860 [Choristoneura fumiferana]|uniref:Uncharacterized protein n=1 Tax=Choristoneura fumiferana TaxID=7141 RepID=A0ACC0K929_CHOFU|nr:hypothetical protein MSG28_013860 [Choristoneura fumiferana]
MTGFVMGWPSNTAGVFSSNSTVLSKPMTTFEISLFGSLVNAGALVIAWAMISVTTNVMMVLVAMALSGVGAAGQAASPIYITEIAEDKIRGTMSACPVNTKYRNAEKAYIIMFQEAAKALAFYRWTDVSSKEVQTGITNIKRQLDPHVENILLEDKEKSRSSRRALMVTSSLVCMSVLMGSLAVMVYAEPLFKQAMLLITSSLASGVCTLLLGTQLQMGWAPHWFSAVLIYVYNFGYTLGAAVVPFIILSEVFLPEEAAESIAFYRCVAVSSKEVEIEIAKIRLQLDPRIDEILHSENASGVLTLLLGTQLQCHWAPHWATAVLIYSYCFIYTLGAATVPFILTAEVFLPESPVSLVPYTASSVYQKPRVYPPMRFNCCS